MSFRDSVCRVVASIPPGRVMSYSMVASLAGSRSAARAVGNLMARNLHPGTGPGKIPCHRVVRSDGSLGGYTSSRGPQEKKRLIKGEGIVLKKGRIRSEHFL